MDHSTVQINNFAYPNGSAIKLQIADNQNITAMSTISLSICQPGTFCWPICNFPKITEPFIPYT